MQEGISFFDRVKKFLSNRQTFNEFLKLCNLFNQEIIDKDTLIHKTHKFIGGNVDLMSWFKRWMNYEPQDKYIENSARIPGGKVALSNCRGLGPSYRLLPKRERLRICSGRDETCNMVLNDEWVSHPTWASEESGFIAHRKNQHEEALHRIEEERHDYDINVEACVRTMRRSAVTSCQRALVARAQQSIDESLRKYTVESADKKSSRTCSADQVQSFQSYSAV